jgi:hypothetical protein
MVIMQPSIHETISNINFTALRNTARHGWHDGPIGGAQRGLRTSVTYGFLILALCLMIADFCRLMRAPATAPAAASSSYHSARM